MNKQGSIYEIAIEQERVKNEVLAKDFERLLKEVALAVDSNRLANVNGKSYQYVRMILNTNGDQRPFPLEFVPSLISCAPELFAEKILNWLCDLCEREHPEKRRTLTPEEELKLLKIKLKDMKLDMHPDLRGLI